MATASTISESVNHPGSPSGGLVITLTPLPPDALDRMLENLSIAFSEQSIQVATPDPVPSSPPAGSRMRVFTYTPAAPAPGGWVLTAADFLNAYKITQEHGAVGGLLFGPEAHTVAPEGLAALASGVLSGTSDLTMPRYALGPHDALVNSAILYPTSRALFGTRPRYPLAVDLAFSLRMAEKLATAAQKFTAAGQNTAIMWPVDEAASAGFSIAEVPIGARSIPAPDTADLNTILARVAGSLFSDVDAKAGFWQRARLAYSPKAAAATVRDAASHDGSAVPPDMPDMQPMLDSFRLAYSNLHEIWSLVLPPNSLLGLKKLSLMPPATFRMPDALWARIVYDFILAYRLRTINRGHLMGALTPLYLAWVASHLRLASSTGPDSVAAETHIEALAAAFEADKPYLVSRWRWPDRFNP
jgi:glucosylglycerate synthase